MTQHTQPVVAAQHHQQQQQHQNSTPQQQQQQQQTTTTSNSNNNNVSNNNNNSNTTPTTSNPTTNNNQTQTVAVQQHQNNTNNNTYQNAGGQQMFNPQIPSYVPTPGMPAHHHPSHQHHHQAGAMYQTMIPAALPSNVFVNNVTANVNLHGWAHTVPHGTWVHPGGAPQYIHGEMPPEQGGSVLQSMPVALPAPNALAGPLINPNPKAISGGSWGSGRGRGRGGAGGSRRSNYNMQRHPPSEGSPAPQQSGQNQQDMQQQQSGQGTDAQQMMTTLPPSYMSHPQYATHAAQYPFGYPTYFTQQPMIHAGQSAAAQQATGTPLYFSAMPMYNGPPVYNYGYYLPPVMNQSEYPYAEEVGVGDERQAAGDGAMMWHQAPMYADEYGMTPADMHAVPSEDMNHNASSMGSANETPNLLSPNYPPMYEQMTQQMGVMQIYEDPQMGTMQVMHPQGSVPQMEEELSECGSQPSTTIQMVPQPIQMVPAAAPMPLPNAPAASNEQILQQPQHTLHMIPVTTGGAIMPIENSATPQTTPQHQVQHQPQQTVTGDNTNESNIQTTYEHVSQIQPGESVTSLNDELAQPPNADNIAPVTTNEYQQQQIAPQQQQVQTQSVLVEAVQTDNYNIQEITENSQQKTSKTVATVTAISTSTDVAIETVATNRQQQPPVYQHQQQQHHTQERPQKQQPQHHQQQYMAKQNVPPQQQQQQYQHQQLQTAPPVAQQQNTHYQSSNQQQQQHHHSQQQQHQQHHHHTQQQQQHHQSQQQQQSYDNRKSSQMYQQQHQSRNRKYDYHHNDGGHQQQPQQQTTKSMSWTNSSQHKKSTNTVGVTATPTSSHSSYNKSSNTTNASTTHTHVTRTYTNQHHSNYQQQNYHYQQQQQQQHQPSTRNHAAMKMPSSPIASGPNNPMERKTSQSSDAVKTQQQQQQSTSTASTTAAPHQFQTPQQQPQQHQQSQQTSTSDMVQQQQTPISTTTASVSLSSSATPAVGNTISSNKQSTQQSQHYPPGFATKKHSVSNQGHSSSNSASNTATTTANVTPTAATNNNVESTSSSTSSSTNTPAINLAPPVSNNTPASTSTTWASLFASSSNTNQASNTSNTTTSSNNLTGSTANTSSSSTPAYSKKPIAKVAPYEGITPVTPPPPVQTPGNLSYSAASAQNLPPPTSTSGNAKKSSLANEQQSQRNSLANLDEYSVKFAEFLTKYKSDWAPISLRPRGLTNRSNYCYINSILQALLGCSPLYNLIRSIPKQAANLCEVKTPTVNAMINFMSNFSNLPSGLRLRNAKGGKGNKDDLGGDLQCDPAFEPTEIYKLWNDSREEHVEGRQEDAEEFLSYILNKLNDEMLEVIKLIAKPNPEQNGQNEPPEEDGDAWQMICNNRNKGSITRQTDFGCTPLSDIFRGELRSRLQREGELSTDDIQPFFTLQLNIEKAASVKEALEILVGRDQLEGVTGSKSKQEVVAWQQMNLEKLPPVLILHLKWFDYRSDGCTKILKKVEFPVELKIDTKILASKNYSQKKRAYRLFAVVYHDGKEATKGHYITDVYHTGYGSWLRYDDSSVKPVSENHVLLPRTPRVPYLLCYRRCDTIPQQSNQNNSSSGNNNSSGNTQSSSGK